MRIAVVAPSCTLKREAAEAVQAIVAARGDCELVIHPQCFLSDGHFAGPDEARLAALREVMADPAVDAVWFARGGYGSNRIAEAALADLPAAARGKLYLGYSDAGFLLAGLSQGRARGRVGADAAGRAARRRRGGGQSRARLAGPARSCRARAGARGPAMAFNLTVLSNLLGTPLEPDFTGVDLLIEDVGEHLYRIDRSMFHVTASADSARCAECGSGGSPTSSPTTPISAATKRDRRAMVRAAPASLSAAARTSAMTPRTGSFRSRRKSLIFPLQ